MEGKGRCGAPSRSVDRAKTSVYPAFALGTPHSRRRKVMRQFVRSAVAIAALAAFSAGAQAQTTLKMQATWPASLTLYENFTYFVDRVQKVSGGTLKIDAMPAGQVVPAFEVLDATHKKVLDGAHAWS